MPTQSHPPTEKHTQSDTHTHSNMQNDPQTLIGAYIPRTPTTGQAHLGTCVRAQTYSLQEQRCACSTRKVSLTWTGVGLTPPPPCDPLLPLTSPRPPVQWPAPAQAFHLLFLLHDLSLCPFLNSALTSGSAGTLLFLQLQRAKEIFAKRAGAQCFESLPAQPQSAKFSLLSWDDGCGQPRPAPGPDRGTVPGKLAQCQFSSQGWGHTGLALGSEPGKVPRAAARGRGFCIREDVDRALGFSVSLSLLGQGAQGSAHLEEPEGL